MDTMIESIDTGYIVTLITETKRYGNIEQWFPPTVPEETAIENMIVRFNKINNLPEPTDIDSMHPTIMTPDNN